MSFGDGLMLDQRTIRHFMHALKLSVAIDADDYAERAKVIRWCVHDAIICDWQLRQR